MKEGRPGCLRPGCLVKGFLAFGLLAYFGMGMGRPSEYWLCIGPIQAFEGPESVMLFVEIQLVTWRPGPIQSPRSYRVPSRLMRIEVARDGTAEVATLRPEGDGYMTFNANTSSVFKLPDGFYVLQSAQLLKVDGDRIETLPDKVAEAIRNAAGLQDGWRRGDLVDRVSERNGWKHLEELWHYIGRKGTSAPIESVRHQIRLWCEADEGEDSIRAKSTAQGADWTATVLTVDKKRWRSYRESLKTEAHRLNPYRPRDRRRIAPAVPQG